MYGYLLKTLSLQRVSFGGHLHPQEKYDRLQQQRAEFRVLLPLDRLLRALSSSLSLERRVSLVTPSAEKMQLTCRSVRFNRRANLTSFTLCWNVNNDMKGIYLKTLLPSESLNSLFPYLSTHVY